MSWSFALPMAVWFQLLFPAAEWGFYAHQKINRLAVFTLPPGLIEFYKGNIDFIEKEATAPDKRRYASGFEAVRHYMDLDHWGEMPFENLPRQWGEALYRHAIWNIILPGDTIAFVTAEILLDSFAYHNGLKLFKGQILHQYYEEAWTLPCDSLRFVAKLDTLACKMVQVEDGFSLHGILPYHLHAVQQKLTKAFYDRDWDRIKRYSADLGHYIGDAHVPLHTSSNYNGQKTNQIGIHAFWETRLPELFAEETYDFWVGGATYVENTEDFFWNMVLESHQLVTPVLNAESELRRSWRANRQICPMERGGVMVPLECPEYAAAFQEKMGGMVEERMRQAIHRLGSAWLTAWIDAGKPDLTNWREERLPEFLPEHRDSLKERIPARPH